MLLSGARDSIFYDSPLSDLGQQQAAELRSHVFTPVLSAESDKHAKFHRILRGESPKPSILVSSNLRRALTTAVLTFRERLSKTEEKISLIPHLQEISRNPDALSIIPPFGAPSLSFAEEGHADVDRIRKVYATQVDPSFNFGNKSPKFSGQTRLNAFATWVFTQPHDVIAVGHSLWFRSFFQEYLPLKDSHPAKDRKLTNCGAVGLTLEKLTLKDGSSIYRIDKESIALVYGGFKK